MKMIEMEDWEWKEIDYDDEGEPNLDIIEEEEHLKLVAECEKDCEKICNSNSNECYIDCWTAC